MEISFVLAVYNKLDLTKECYKHIRLLYPDAPLIISSGGSDDGTMEWLESLDDGNLFYTHTNKRLSFSETYNEGIKLVRTKRLVLIHNDMVIGKYFLENLELLSKDDTLLCYTTIEPPVFKGHKRPGKVIMDYGNSFENFNHNLFNQYVEDHKDKYTLYDGGVFFMSGTKELFEDVGYFDGFSFIPAFCEDDDFLIRTKLKGYKLKTTESAIVYHFVSQTSRFSKEFENERFKYELSSNRNFIRKWGISISGFNDVNYQTEDKFEYKPISMGLVMSGDDINLLANLEPIFNKIKCNDRLVEPYCNQEQVNTNYKLKEKFTSFDNCDVIIEVPERLTNETFNVLLKLRLVIPQYEKGEYKLNEIKITIN